MAQISYGTITITDTTDIEFTIEYARNQSTSSPPAQSSSDWSTTRPTWAQGYYIWQRTRIHKYGTSESEDTFSTAICLSGSTGETGQSLIATKTQYTHVANDVTITTQNHLSYTWTDNVPAYDATKPAYWGRITNTYSNPSKTEYIVYKDNGITDSIGKSAEAEVKATNALSTSQQTAAKVKNFWWDSSGAHVASGKNGNEVTVDTISTYGYHALMGLTGINFNYDGAKVVDLNSTTPSLDFYQPPTISGNTVTQGKKTMMLSANALRFYDPTNGTSEQAVLDSNGLLLKEGGIKSGSVNAGNSGFVYLSTKNYGSNLTINGHQASNWREVIGTKFGVDADGNLYASNADISGKITSSDGEIGGFAIDSSSIHTKNVAITSNANNSVGLSSSTFTRTINGVSRESLKFAIGSKFGVASDGTLYATGGVFDSYYTKEETDEAIDDIEFGGRNILKNSDQSVLQLWSTARANGGTMTIEEGKTVSEWGTNEARRVYGKAGSTNNLFGIINNVYASSQISITDQPYVFSIYIKNQGTNAILISFNNLASDASVAVGETVRVVSSNAKGNGINNTQFAIAASEASATYDFIYWHPQIEYGNKVTDWTPAPEDIKSIHTLLSSNTGGASYADLLNWCKDGVTGSWGVQSTTGVHVGDTIRIGYPILDMGTAGNRPIAYCIGTVTSINSATNISMTSHGLDTTVIDGGNILTNSVGANQIKANSINAEHLAISDNTNLATANEFYEGSLPTKIDNYWQAVIENGYLVKKYGVNQHYLMMTAYTPSSFKTNDELYYEFDGKLSSPGTVYLYAWGWDSNESMVANNNVSISMGTSDAHYSGTLKLTNSGWSTNANNAKKYILGFYDELSAKLYVKNVIIRRKSGGELIVDGTLTVGALSESAKNDVLNSKLHFGGRNLIRMLVPGNGTVVGNNQNPDYYFDPNNGGEYWIQCTTAGGGKNWTQIYNNPYWTLPTSLRGKEAIFHADYIHASNSTVDEYVYLSFYNSSGSNIRNVALNEATLSAKFTIPSDATHYQLIIRMDQQCQSLVGDTMIARGIKFELGNVETAWTMAPEDVYSGGENLYEGATFPFSGNGLTMSLESDGWFRVTGTCNNTNVAIVNPTGNWPNTKYKGGAYTLTVEDDGVLKDGKISVQFYRYRSSGAGFAPIYYTGGSYFASVEPNGYILRVCLFLTAEAKGTVVNGRIRWKLERGTQSSDWSHANNQITDINGTGIRVHPANTINNSAVINTDGLEIFRGGTTTAYSVAKFGSSTRVGKDSDKHISITSDSISIWSGTEGTTTNKLAEFGSSIKLFRPGTSTVMVNINSDGQAFFNGAIYAASGTIGGYDITSNSIQAQVDGSGNKVAIGSGLFWHFMSWGAGNLAFGVGSRAKTTDGWTWKFLVDHTGNLSAQNANISGTITATDGTIGGCSLANNNLQVSESHISGTLGANKIRVSEINIGSLSGAKNYARPNLARSVQNYNINMSNSNATYSYNRRNGALRVNAVNAGGAQVYVTDSVYQPERFVGQKMTLSAAYLSPSKSSFRSFVYAYGLVNNSYVTLAAISKTQLTTTFTVPSGITKLGLIYRVDQDNGCAAGDYCWFTEVKVEIGDTATKWIPEDTDGSAAPFVTNIGSTGIKIHPEDNETNYAQINANGMQIYKGNVSVAEYGDTARIGKDASPHIAVTSSEIQMWKGASSNSANKLFSITTTHNMPALASDTDIWLESGSSGGNFSTIHVSGPEAGMQAEDASHDSALYVIANGTSLVNFDTRYLQLSGQASDSTLWFIDDTTPPQGSQAFNAIWHKSANDNYGLYRPSSSSRRYKEDIMPVQSDRLDPHRLYDIEVVQFKFKEGTFLQDDPYEQNRVNVVGFIAEDVYEHYPQAAIILDDEVENWDERYIIPPMLKLIQEQHEQINSLTKRIEALEEKIL